MATSKDLGLKLTQERAAAAKWWDDLPVVDGQKNISADQVQEWHTRNEALTALQTEYEGVVAAEKSAAENMLKLMPRGDVQPDVKDSPADIVTKGAMLGALRKGFDANREAIAAMAAGKLSNGSIHIELPGELKTLITTADMTSPADRLRTTGMALYYGDVEDLFAHGTTGAKNIEYYIQTTDTDNSAAVAEGSAVTDSALSWTLTTDEVETVQAWIPMTRESLEDDSFMQSTVTGRLALHLQKKSSQIMLSGTGTTPIPWGVAVRTGVQTQAKGADTAFDAIHKAITLVEVTGDSTADAICIHPTDWENLRLTRTVDGIYVLGSPVQSGPLSLWGLPVRKTIGVVAAGTAGTALVGAFSTEAMVVTRQGLSVEISTEHSTYFTERKVAVAMSRRFTVAGFRPSAFAKVTGL